MRWLLVALLLVPAVSFAAEGDGRYQLVNSKDEIYMVDTKTGKTWNFAKINTVPLWLPNFYICGTDSFSKTPDCKETQKLPRIEPHF